VKRFEITISRSRDKEASVTRYQLQTDQPTSRPEAGDPDCMEPLAPLAPTDSGATQTRSQ